MSRQKYINKQVNRSDKAVLIYSALQECSNIVQVVNEDTQSTTWGATLVENAVIAREADLRCNASDLLNRKRTTRTRSRGFALNH